jgi:hypothetical protein
VKALVLIALLAAPALAQEPPPPPPCPCQACVVTCGDAEDDEPPSQAAREEVVIAAPAPPKRTPGRGIIELTAMPGYQHFLGSDWLGTNLSLGFGGEARNGFQAIARFGALVGGSSVGLPYQHFTLSAAFVIPTGTRFHLTLGHQFGFLVVDEPHSSDGSAWSPTMGGYVEPTIDLYRGTEKRLALVGRIAYDFIFVNRGDPNSVTLNLGIAYSF